MKELSMPPRTQIYSLFLVALLAPAAPAGTPTPPARGIDRPFARTAEMADRASAARDESIRSSTTDAERAARSTERDPTSSRPGTLESDPSGRSGRPEM